jgi:16S rRNA processing protein RimM
VAERHDPADDRLVVALVRGVHGLRGAVRVEVLTDRPEDRFRAGAVLHREGSDAPLTIASADAVQDGPGWRIRFQEVTDRAGADGLRDAYLETVLRPGSDLGRGEVYWHEVVGVPVRGLDGTELGTVQDVYRVAENEVYVVGGAAYGSWDLPAVRAFIRIFAPRRGEIVVDAEALDLQPLKQRPTGEDRPRAPRRRGPRRRASVVAEVPVSPDVPIPADVPVSADAPQAPVAANVSEAPASHDAGPAPSATEPATGSAVERAERADRPEPAS